MPTKKVSFIVNPLLSAACISVVLLCSVVAVILVSLRDYVASVIFAVIAAVYFIVGINYFSFVSFSEHGVLLSFLGIKRRFFTWDEISEAGVAGSKLFNKDNKKKVGTLYLYFSKEKMTENERFNMMLKFPPKNKIYLCYTEKRLKAIRWFFDGKLAYFNIGDLEV